MLQLNLPYILLALILLSLAFLNVYSTRQFNLSVYSSSAVQVSQSICLQNKKQTSFYNLSNPRHRRRSVAISAQGDDHNPADMINSSGAPFNPQFLGVLQQSLARQGADALTKGLPPAEERISAVEEVLTTALNQSKQSYRMLSQWRLQIDAQIAAQEKQITRMEFALNKARNDAAMMKTLKKMVYENESD